MSEGVVFLIAAGASTGVGGSLPVSAAAFRAGITRTERVALGGGPDAWGHAVRVATLEPSSPDERAASLLWSALAQAWQPMKATLGTLRVGAWCAGPALLAARVARQLGLDRKQVLDQGGHGSAGLFAVSEARRALLEGRLDVAVVVGAGVPSSDAALAQARAAGRLLGGSSSVGTVPGEAAAALIWVSESTLRQHGLRSLGRLVSVVKAEEASGGDAPCTGQALTEAARGALSGLAGGQRVAHVLCDLNGERLRTDEWGFTLPRLLPFLQEPGAFATPISAFGDAGAPAGLLLLALASQLYRPAAGATAPCLIWSSSAWRERAAALFEAAEAPPVGSERDPVLPGWARALDSGVLEELADEAAFRFGQRQYQYAEAPAALPGVALAAISRIELLLDRLLSGLAECGPRGADVALQAVAAQPTPGALYAALRTALEAARDTRAVQIIEAHVAPAPPLLPAALLALRHAPPAGGGLTARVGAWLEAGPVLAALALELAAQAGLRVSGAALRAHGELLDEAAQDDAGVDAGASWLAALASLGDPDQRELLARWQFSPHERLRRCWALAELRLGQEAGRARVLARCVEDPAVVLPAALAASPDDVQSVLEIASALSGRDACLALGVLGDPGAIPRLLERLADPGSAAVSSWALELLLGTAPLGTRLEPDLDERAPPREVPAISRDPAAWRAVADRVLAQHPAGARLRAGTLASVASTLSLLERLHLPPRVRRYLAHELGIRWQVTPSVDVSALLRQQQATRVAIAALPSAGAPGAW